MTHSLMITLKLQAASINVLLRSLVKDDVIHRKKDAIKLLEHAHATGILGDVRAPRWELILASPVCDQPSSMACSHSRFAQSHAASEAEHIKLVIRTLKLMGEAGVPHYSKEHNGSRTMAAALAVFAKQVQLQTSADLWHLMAIFLGRQCSQRAFAVGESCWDQIGCRFQDCADATRTGSQFRGGLSSVIMCQCCDPGA